MIDRLGAVHLFRSHVMRGADRLLSRGQENIPFFSPHDLGDSEIGNFDSTAFVEEDVLRFNVAVDNAFFVGELECLADLRHDFKSSIWLQLARYFQLAQVEPIDKLHHKEGHAPRLAKLVEHHNIRMI